MYHDTVTGLDEQALDGKHPDTDFGGVGHGENSRTEEYLYNSISTACLMGEETVVLLDSDSGDSLFLTQHEAQTVRTVRRHRPGENALNPFVAIEPFCENEESSSTHRSWEIPLKPRRSRKISQQRWRRHNRKYLSRRESLTFEHAALGGFFKCVTKMKAGAASERVSVSKRPKQHCKETRGRMSPLSDSDEGEDNEESSDIKIVDLQDFIPGYKIARKGYNPWLEGSDTLGTVTEETKDAPKTTPTILGSCSRSLGSDREAGSSENECHESDSESQPVQCSSSEVTSSCESDVLDTCFRQDEMRRKAQRASHPDSELNTGVEKLRTMRKDPVKKRRAAAETPPRVTMIQGEVSEKEGRIEHIPLRDLLVKQPLDPGDLGESQGSKKGEEEEGSLWDATSQGDRELNLENNGQRISTMEKSAGRKTMILPVAIREDEKWTTGEDEETNIDLQGSVHEDRLTVTDLVYVETEDIEIDTVEDIILGVMEAQPAGLLREKKESRRKEMDDEEPVDRPLDSVPEEGGTVGCAAEPDLHAQSPRNCQHQTQDKEYCSRAGEGDNSILNFSVPESVRDSASGDVICEEGIRKNKKKDKKDNNGNVEEYVNEPPPETLSDSLHLTHDKERRSGAGVGEQSLFIPSLPEPVGDSVASDVACEEGIRMKKKKKGKKDSNGNVEEYVNEPPSETLSDSLHLTHYKEKNSGAGVGEQFLFIPSLPEPVGDSVASDVACEEGIRKKKKKKRKKDNTGVVEEHISRPPSASETLSDSLHLMHNRERSSGAGVGGHALFISNVPGPVDDSASGDVVCEEGIRRKKKKRKKDKNGNVEEYVNEPPPETLSDSVHLTHDREKNSGVAERSLSISSVPEPVVDSASGHVILEEGIRKKKRDDGGNVEELVNKPPSCTLKERQIKTQDKVIRSRAGEGGRSHSRSGRPEPVNDSASCDVICEGVIRKKKKKRKRENCENMEEQVSKPLPHMLKDNWHQTKYKEKSSRAGVTEFSQLHSSNPEPVNSSESCEVVCEERMRKKLKKRKGDDNTNICEQVRKPPSHTLSESTRQTKDKEKCFGAGEAERSHLSSSISEPVSDSGDVICQTGLRKKKHKRDSSGNVREHISEPPSRTLKDSLHQTQCKPGAGERSNLNSSIPEHVGASGNIRPEGIKKKTKRERDKSGNEDVHVRKQPSCLLEDSRDSADCSGAGVHEYSHFSSTVTEPIGDSGIGDAFCGERKRKCKKKKRKKDNNENVEEHVNEPPSETLCDSFHQTHRKRDNNMEEQVDKLLLCARISDIQQVIDNGQCGQNTEASLENMEASLTSLTSNEVAKKKKKKKNKKHKTDRKNVKQTDVF